MGQFAIFFLFELGIMGSFLITNKNFSLIGLAHVLLLISIQVFSLFIFTNLSLPQINLKIKIFIKKDLFKRIIIIFFTFLGIYGLYMGALRNFSTNIFTLKFWISTMSNHYREFIVWGSGYTMMDDLTIIPLTISSVFFNKNKFYKIFLVINFLIVFLSAFAYSSRLKIVLAVFIVLIPNSIKLSKKNLKLISIFLLIVMLIFLIWGGGIRGQNTIMYNFTNSDFLWSIYTFTDYYNSTILFSSYALSSSPNNIPNIWNIRNYFGHKQIQGYTNDGKFFVIYKYFGYFSPIFIILESLLYAISWKSFEKRRKFGLFTYPIMVYMIFEGVRIEALLVPDFYIPLILLSIFSLF